MPSQAVSPSRFMPYGAPELKQVARTYLVRAIVAGSGAWVAVFLALLGASAWVLNHAPRIRHANVTAIVLQPPPVLNQVIRIPPVSARAVPRANVGVPIPVPIPAIEAPPDRTITTGGTVGPSTNDSAQRIDPFPTLPPSEEPPPPPDRFVPVDELPEAITQVKPEYSSLAQAAGIQGTVWVRVLVGKDGRVLDAFVDPKHSIPVLDEEALKAAKRWVFKPAFTNNRPVAVWVAIPMRFVLN